MNYYEILKVSRTSTANEIKSSYKKLAKKYHPDLYVGDKKFAEEKIKEINEAYDILSNPETKAEYDEYLNASTQTTMSFPNTNVNQTAKGQKNSTSTESYQSTKVKWSFTKFLAEKFNTLDRKLQLQIFIIFLVVVLSLFLINIIQVQYYLTNHTENISDTIDNTDTSENNTSNFIDNSSQNDNYCNENTFQTLDDLLYDLFESYEVENFYDYNMTESNSF